MNWRNVLDCRKASWESVQEAATVAARCGYKFIAWDDEVYFVLSENGDSRSTGIHVDDVCTKSH